MFAKEPIAISEVIKQTVKRLGLKKGIEQNAAVTCWAEAVGPKIAVKSQAVKIIKGVLYIKAESPVWSQQLSLMSEELKEKINQRLGKKIVKQIRFRS